MSFDANDISNKMTTEPPAKKGWHFSGNGTHLAEFIEAETIEEATEIYNKIKRLISDPAADTALTPAVPATAPEQSTAAMEPETDNHEL